MDGLDVISHAPDSPFREKSHEVEATPLCEACTKIDAQKLLGNVKFNSTQRLELCVQSVMEGRCPFCAFLRTQMRSSDFEKSFDPSTLGNEKLRCVLTSEYVLARDIMRTQDDTCPLIRMGVSIEFREFKPRAIFDPVGRSRQPEDAFGDYITVRKPLEDHFCLSMLRRWLWNCNDHAHSLIRAGGLITPLQPILTKCRFRVVDVFSGELVTLTVPQPYVALSYVWGKAMAHYAAVSPGTGATGDEETLN